MKYIRLIGLLLFSSLTNASQFAQIKLSGWPWPEVELANLKKVASENSWPEAFEEKWKGKTRILDYLSLSITRGSSFKSLPPKFINKEITFTGWVFSMRLLRVSVSNYRLTQCQVIESFGQSMTINLKEMMENITAHTTSCDLWVKQRSDFVTEN